MIARSSLAALLLAACQQGGTGNEGGEQYDASAATDSIGAPHQGMLYGRVTVDGGVVYEGRLRFGNEEEALWINYFNGARGRNPWADQVPADQLPQQRESIELFGKKLASFDSDASLARPFMARFGDIARIEAQGKDLRVTLRTGTVAHLNRYGADDLADGVRIWDNTRGIVDMHERYIHSIEFLAPPRTGSAPHPLYGTVQTRAGNFTGFIQWNREECLSSDALNGVAESGAQMPRFHSIRSIARREGNGAVVTLVDGREIVRAESSESPLAPRGIYVDDARYGRVLVSWESFQQVQFSDSGTGPSYSDFPIGGPLTGVVTTKAGRRISGRLVFDLDESENTETLDAPSNGIDYTIPFRLIASIVTHAPDAPANRRVKVVFRDGSELQLERDGDVSDRNGGMLVFGNGGRTEYVSWGDVAKIDLGND